MSFYRPTVCRICLKICSTDFVKCEELSADILNSSVLCLQPNLGITKDPVFCKECVIHLKRSLEFNIPFQKEIVSCSRLENDEQDYQNIDVKVEKSNDIDHTSKICRYCLKVIDIEGTVAKANSVFIFLQKHFLTMDLTSICETCLDFLWNNLLFTVKCLNTEENLKAYMELFKDNAAEDVDLYSLLKFKINREYGITYSNICKLDNYDTPEVFNPSQTYVDGNNIVAAESTNEPLEPLEINIVIKKEIQDMCGEAVEQVGPIIREEFDIKAEDREQQTLEGIESPSQEEFPKPEVKSDHKCDQCSYQANNRVRLNRHVATHKDHSVAITSKSEECHVQSNNEPSLSDNSVEDKTPTERWGFRCSKCPFQTRYKNHLKRHAITHDNSSEAVLYSCDQCSFQTKHKYSLKQHSVTHRTLPMLKCPLCAYETKQKSYLDSHVLRHDDVTGDTGEIYRCETCSYCTRRKANLKQHLVLHMDEGSFYKCDDCDFHTRHMRVLAEHRLRHKRAEDVKTYKCFQCAYQTVRKGTLKRHLLTHKDLSQVTGYQCDRCSFKTKYKSCLNHHILRLHEC